jgi:FAD dependent oxidoreductase TIGR03364
VRHTTVVAVESSGRQCTVRDARGDVHVADRVIVCTGADYRTLFPDLFRTSGLRLCKLQMMQTTPLPGFRLPHAILSGLSIQRYPAFTSCPSYGLLAAQPIDDDVRAYGIHLLFKQAADGSVVIGDSHEYRDLADAGLLEETTNCAINEAILRYARKMLRLPSWSIQTMWNGYYLAHPGRDMYTETIDGAIHIVTGTGKGMTIGPGFARQHIDAIVT